MSRDYISEVVLNMVYVRWCQGGRTKGKEDPEIYLQPQNLAAWPTLRTRILLEQSTCLPSEWNWFHSMSSRDSTCLSTASLSWDALGAHSMVSPTSTSQLPLLLSRATQEPYQAWGVGTICPPFACSAFYLSANVSKILVFKTGCV